MAGEGKVSGESWSHSRYTATDRYTIKVGGGKEMF